MSLKIQKQNKIYFAFLSIIFSGFLFFGNVHLVSAANSCVCGNGQDIAGEFTSGMTEANCSQGCGTRSDSYVWNGGAPVSITPKNVADKAFDKEPDTCDAVGWLDAKIFNCLLLFVLSIAGFFLSMANTLFEWCVNPDYWAIIFKNPAIYSSWEIVRDLLNITFIIALLYSAFTIIFQVDSPGKKSLLTIVLMALLVNFSFPITLFIVDMSNSLMYTIITTMNFGGNSATGPSGALASITGSSGLSTILNPVGIPGIPELLVSIIFVFILMVTLLATGLLLLIRMITLAILLIFSPIAFVAKILPETKKYASNWWTELFNNAIFGPAMLVGIFVATQIMNKMGTGGKMSFYNVAQNQTNSAMIPLVATMAWFTIPIIILWYVMGTAKKFSIAGAGAIMGQAEKVVKGAGKYASGYSFGQANWKAYQGARKKRSDEMDKNRIGERFGKKVSSIQDRAYSAMGSGDATKRVNKGLDTENKEAIKKADEGNAGVNATDLHTQIQNDLSNTNKTHDEKIAAAGRVKTAMARGKEYEKKIEDDARAVYTRINGVKPPDLATADLEQHPTVLNIVIPPIGGGTPAEVHAYQEAIKRREKQVARLKEEQKRAITTYEKAEKKAIEDAKEAAFVQNRKTIKDAEDSQKIV